MLGHQSILLCKGNKAILMNPQLCTSRMVIANFHASENVRFKLYVVRTSNKTKNLAFVAALDAFFIKSWNIRISQRAVVPDN